MKGPCGPDQLAMGSDGGPGGGRGPGGGVGVPGAHPRIGGASAGHPGAALGQASQGSALASRRGFADGVRGGCIGGVRKRPGAASMPHDDALDEAEAAAQTGQLPVVEKTGRCSVAARRARGGHEEARTDACVDYLPVRAVPFRFHI
jgi:hypothetical protein